jgi:hypothetical protein
MLAASRRCRRAGIGISVLVAFAAISACKPGRSEGLVIPTVHEMQRRIEGRDATVLSIIGSGAFVPLSRSTTQSSQVLAANLVRKAGLGTASAGVVLHATGSAGGIAQFCRADFSGFLRNASDRLANGSPSGINHAMATAAMMEGVGYFEYVHGATATISDREMSERELAVCRSNSVRHEQIVLGVGTVEGRASTVYLFLNPDRLRESRSARRVFSVLADPAAWGQGGVLQSSGITPPPAVAADRGRRTIDSLVRAAGGL